MFAKIILAALLVVALAGATAAQMPEKGLVIRVMENRLLFIDLGRQDGVQEGDIFDIVDADVITHPLSGDTLSITPKSVGALRVRQVYAKMSLAELMHMQGDKNPMLMRVAAIDDPDRLMEVQHFLKQSSLGGGGVSQRATLIPGLYQYRMGSKKKGLVLLGAEFASLALGIGYRASSNDWFDQYKKLPDGSSQDDFDFYFTEANDRRSISSRFFLLAGALYAYNLVDVMWMGGGGMSMDARVQRPLSLDLGLDLDGSPLLKLTRRF